jgi:D-alanine-D-alanine ligase
MQKDIIITFGGDSPEHDVSIITALQAWQHVDKAKYKTHLIYFDRENKPYYFKKLKTKKDFYKTQRILITFGKDKKGGYFRTNNLFSSKIYPEANLMCFHGGTGESGSLAGLFEILNIPFSSSSLESSALCMNKIISKKIVSESDVNIVESVYKTRAEIQKNSLGATTDIVSKLKLPLIVKPAHLGSSVGIKVARTQLELEKALKETSYLDDQVLIEKYLENIVEYNISIFRYKSEIQHSEIERPKPKDEILSFTDKYRSGQKKTGSNAGMASLSRELPAQISDEMKQKIRFVGEKIYNLLQCKGLVRIDFIYHNEILYFNEINPIPGSLSYYLWEPLGIQYSELLDMMIENAIWESQNKVRVKYESSDIVKTFIVN